jgi:hypothetical protein
VALQNNLQQLFRRQLFRPVESRGFQAAWLCESQSSRCTCVKASSEVFMHLHPHFFMVAHLPNPKATRQLQPKPSHPSPIRHGKVLDNECSCCFRHISVEREGQGKSSIAAFLSILGLASQGIRGRRCPDAAGSGPLQQRKRTSRCYGRVYKLD